MRKTLAAVVLSAMTLVSCSDPTLTKVAKGLTDYGAAIHGVETSVIQAQQQGVITVEQARPVIMLLVKLNDAGVQASALTRNLTKLPAANKGQLVQILSPVIQALQQATSSGLIGVPDGPTKTNILIGLNTALLALNTIQPLLMSSVHGVGSPVAVAYAWTDLCPSYEGVI
jgi:hypothetical protein